VYGSLLIILDKKTNGTSPGKIIVAHKSIPFDTEPKYRFGFRIMVIKIKNDKNIKAI